MNFHAVAKASSE